MEENEKLVIEVYSYLYKKKYSTSYQLQLEKNKTLIANFYKNISKKYPVDSIGPQFMIDYMLFQFNYWEDKETKRNISPGWILGPKAIERFYNKNTHYDYFYKEFTRKYHIIVSEIKEIFEPPPPELDKFLEKRKQQFEGEARLLFCLDNTTLINNKSMVCLTCSEREYCKILKQEHYPELCSKH